MPDTSIRLELPYILPSQSQKHVTYNEAMQRLDLLAQIVVEEFDAVHPPAVPQEAQVWALSNMPQGAWAGHGGTLAAWAQEGWVYLAPKKGWVASDGDTARIWNGSTWFTLSTGDLSNIPGVGINSSYDATNRLAVSADATLLTHASAGHQLKINKAAATDTASLLFQTGWSGRAEMGTSGSDNFEIKLSADGANWLTGMALDVTSGGAQFPNGASFTEVSVAGQITGAAITQSQADTTPGRLLKTHDWGVGNAITLTAADNLDNLPGSGFYYNQTAENCTGNNYPIASAGAVLCIFHTPGNGVQKFISHGGSSSAQDLREFSRSYGAAGWGPWVELFHQGTVLGPVSQSAGVPTGSVIERGANANGEYVRFADGTQICHLNVNSAILIETSAGAIYQGDSVENWVYPAAFSTIPSVTGSANATWIWIAVGAVATTNCNYRGLSFKTNPTIGPIRFMAIGRWF
ncbi:DUF2793 domain-containing protein [Thioclava sp. A2]|uniref:DUF2793 domain-containing protein n=1 Tax=Thioclava sp. FCG-A2 TaxID=3080562 RepID=UPI002952B9AB|nr:DUF2793 domain-containing protein [Thioclava sp. A2]MDV7270700.1 DUF2793 domain-containing protein [Thioclava sp. A2]